ncbi:ladderlectin-like [Scomber japonicus]|uniref:ladderlectin-like n=1 Tax=Scomber japonicus TaxID=13676 RepID=UPI00230579FF|nr:ladderlectin-like [Scomber japonicus]
MRIVLLLCAAFVLRVATEEGFSPTEVAESGKGCLPDWKQRGSRCFKLFTTLMTWIDAEKHCVSLGANLASVHNLIEQNFLFKMVSGTKYTRAWIGGSNAVEISTWLWSDGSMFNYTNWDRGEPNNLYNQEKCMESILEASPLLGWNDLNCEDSRPFICGTKPDVPLKLP